MITTNNIAITKYAFYDFEFGILKIGYTDGKVVSLKRLNEIDCESERSELSDLTFTQIEEYLNGSRKTFNFPYVLEGTVFQKQVWEALCNLPFGETRTYKQLAEFIGNPKACRAVGMANNKNPIFIVVPCHRVIGSNGKLVGYAGGLEMKRRLIEIERGI